MYMEAQPPYGYKKDPKQNRLFYDKNYLIIAEEASKTVRLIFDLVLTNIGVVKITRELNNRKIVPPSIYKSNNEDLRFTKLTSTRRQFWNTNTV